MAVLYLYLSRKKFERVRGNMRSSHCDEFNGTYIFSNVKAQNVFSIIFVMLFILWTNRSGNSPEHYVISHYFEKCIVIRK